jgi:hypothetical protein
VTRRFVLLGPVLSMAAACVTATAGTATAPVVVQVDVAAGACVERGLRSSNLRVRVQTHDRIAAAEADLVVGPDATLGRALESGDLVEAGAVELGEVRWVLVARVGTPPPWVELERAQPEIWVLGGPAGDHARKALQRLSPARVHSSRQPAELAAAHLALVPMPLAGDGQTRPAPVEPLRMRAVLTRRAAASAAARTALRSLDSASLRQCLGAR